MTTPLLRIEFPALPDKDLLTNARDGRLSKWERATAVKATKAQWTPFFNSVLQSTRFRQSAAGPRLFLVWTLYVESYRSPDDDGWTAALKPIRDLLCELGVFWGDGPKYIGGSAYFVEVRKMNANTCTLDVWEYETIRRLLT